ncbi:hypothetical protein E2562_000665 [Oryza meyeriana var. granulata]|uniref:Uncharacterized protein n=1 Tax=Oryza meyeriana var. granulata TaxID=110450 RepID=A0A6G1DUD6_9ORYZ|nr:hypothetical protein E2562_000665 [Oryza meyeriana var. granulata]
MDIMSGMFRPAFDRIRPSIASAAEFGFSRVVSFTGSFNSRTGLLAGDGEETPPRSQAHETTPSTSTGGGGAFDIEAPATTPDQAVRDGGGASQDGEAAAADDEPKRVSKSVQTVCLFVASASLAMSVNLPARPGPRAGALYGANLGFICLGLFASLGLSMYTIVSRPGDVAVARVQKWGMLLAVASVLASFTLRMCATLPGKTLESAWITFFLLAGAATLYLTLAWKLWGGGRPQQQMINNVNEEADDPL